MAHPPRPALGRRSRRRRRNPIRRRRPTSVRGGSLGSSGAPWLTRRWAAAHGGRRLRSGGGRDQGRSSVRRGTLDGMRMRLGMGRHTRRAGSSTCFGFSAHKPSVPCSKLYKKFRFFICIVFFSLCFTTPFQGHDGPSSVGPGLGLRTKRHPPRVQNSKTNLNFKFIETQIHKATKINFNFQNFIDRYLVLESDQRGEGAGEVLSHHTARASAIPS